MITGLKENELYKYKDVCKILGQDTKRSDSRKAQMKAWTNAFEYEMVTTQVLKITKIIDLDADISVKHGGARVGSGRSTKLQEEFDYILNAYLHREFSRNSYNAQPKLCTAYAANSVLSTYFGIQSEWFYSAKHDKNVDKEKFKEVSKKLIEKRNSLIIKKIENDDRLTLSKGIIAYKTKDEDSPFEYRDDFLDMYDEKFKEYLTKNHTSINRVIDENKWGRLTDYCSSFFDGFDKVTKVHKIEYPVNILKEYDLNELKKQQGIFNNTVADDVLKFFSDKYAGADISEYIYIINHYVRINPQL